MKFGLDWKLHTWRWGLWKSQNGWWQLDLGPLYIYGQFKRS